MAAKSGQMVKVATGIYKRSGRYVVPIHDPKTNKRPYFYPDNPHDWPDPERAQPANTLRAARTLKHELESAKARNTQGPTETVRSFAERWMKDYGSHRGATTWALYTERISAFVDDCGDLELGEVSRKLARAWILGGAVPSDIESIARDWKGAKTENGRVVVPGHRARHNTLRAMFSDAERDGLITGNPFARMRLAESRGRRDITVLTETEVHTLERIARETHGEFGPTFAAMIATAAWLGIRPGELYALRWQNIDFSKGEVYIDYQLSDQGDFRPPKNGEPRTILLLPGAERALKDLPRKIGIDFVFTTARDDRPFAQHSLFYYWNPVRSAFVAKLPKDHHLKLRMRSNLKDNLDFYELRHFCATWLLDQGASREDVAMQLGHRDGGKLVAEVYGHPSEERARDRLRRVIAAAS